MTAGTGPAWLPDGCPAWCADRDHRDADRLEDRSHGGVFTHITLTAEEPPGHDSEHGAEDAPTRVEITLSQHYREVEPTIWLAQEQTLKGFHLTPAEAEELAQVLLRMVATARG